MEHRITRRATLGGGLSLALLPRVVQAQDVEMTPDSPVPPLPADLASRADAPAYRPTGVAQPVGPAKPTQVEIEQARAILEAAPTSSTPVEVARYFLDLGQASDTRAAYVREWPVRANPLIQTLFVATQTNPYGDITPWCAAFVNWCIARAGATRTNAGISREHRFTSAELARTSRSAASGSFRCWTSVIDPRPGDLAVFREPGSTAACSGKGHVAFLLERLPGGDLRILGGNQILRGTSGAVTASRYPLAGGERGRLRFFGFRAAAAPRRS